MRPKHQSFRNFNLAVLATAVVSITSDHANGTPIAGDTINGDLTVTGWGKFANGVDLGQNGDVLLNWVAPDLSNPVGTATFDMVQAQGAFLWRDTITTSPAPSAKNKMRLDRSNALSLFRSDGTVGLLIDPENGKITLVAAGASSGLFFGNNPLPTLKAATNGSAIFPSQVTLQSGLQLTGTAGLVQLGGTTPATSSTTGALTVAGGIGVGMDSYFNGVRVGKGTGNVATNTAIGAAALNLNTSGTYNTAAGASALNANSTGYYNTAAGAYALSTNTTGFCNTAAGMQSLRGNSTGYYNTAAGTYALFANSTGYYNTAAGTYSLRANTAGYYNTASGTYALSANTTGSSNTSAGVFSLYTNTTGIGNSASGVYALFANSTGSNNTGSGMYALYANTIGNNNVSVGSYAAYFQANGTTPLTDPENSIYIGANVRGKDNNDSNSIVIGSKAIGEGANTTVIGTASTVKAHLYGELVATNATLGGYPVLTTRSGANAALTNAATLALGNNAAATQQGAIAIGQNARATMSSAIALGDYASAAGTSAIALNGSSATGDYSFAASLGTAGQNYSLGLSVGQAYGASAIALGGYDEGWSDANYAVATGSVAVGGLMNAALGAYSYAMGSKVTSSSPYSFAIGSQNLSRTTLYPSEEFSWDGLGPVVSNAVDWVEDSSLLEVGNGNPDAPAFETSNAITTLKNGQTTLSNKAWNARPVATSPLADPSALPTDSDGNALVVEGHTVLKGKVVIEQAQGDISMGIYGGD